MKLYVRFFLFFYVFSKSKKHDFLRFLNCCTRFPEQWAGALSDDAVWRLFVAYIGPKSRTERPRKTKISRGSPRHTWLGHHFQGQKVKGQGHQAALLTAVLVRQAAAAVGMGTCWPWETAAMLPSARRRKALRRPRGRRGAGHIVAAARLQLVKYALHAKANTLTRDPFYSTLLMLLKAVSVIWWDCTSTMSKSEMSNITDAFNGVLWKVCRNKVVFPL